MTDSNTPINITKLAFFYVIISLSINVFMIGYIATSDLTLVQQDENMLNLYLTEGLAGLIGEEGFYSTINEYQDDKISTNISNRKEAGDYLKANNENEGFLSSLFEGALNIVSFVDSLANIITLASPFIIFQVWEFIGNPFTKIIITIFVLIQSLIIMIATGRFISHLGRD
jgi:hypothetical protein